MLDFSSPEQRRRAGGSSSQQFDRYVNKMNMMHPTPTARYPGELEDRYRMGMGGQYNSKQMMSMLNQAIKDRNENIKKAVRMEQRGEGTFEECLDALETPMKPLPGMPTGFIGGQAQYSPYKPYRGF